MADSPTARLRRPLHAMYAVAPGFEPHHVLHPEHGLFAPDMVLQQCSEDDAKRRGRWFNDDRPGRV